MLPSYSGSGRWRITILQISMARRPTLETRREALQLRKSSSWRPLTPWLKMMWSLVGRTRKAENMVEMATSVSASSHQFTQPWAIQMEHLVTLCSVAQPMNYWQPRAIMTDLSLMFLVSTQEAFDEGMKTWDGWSGRDVGLVIDQKVLENVFKGEYTSWAAFKKAMYKSGLISWPSSNQLPLSTSLKSKQYQESNHSLLCRDAAVDGRSRGRGCAQHYQCY